MKSTVKSAAGLSRSKLVFLFACVCLGLIILYFLVFFDPVVARVGDYRITRRDAERRTQVLRVFYPSEKRELGLDLLVNSYILAQIAKTHGRELNDESVRKEELRIDRTTRDPKMLVRVKEIFGNDMDSYRRVFVLPTLADRFVYENIFSRSATIHAETRKKVEQFIAQASRPGADFPQLVTQAQLRIERVAISAEHGFEWRSHENPEAGVGAQSKGRERLLLERKERAERKGGRETKKGSRRGKHAQGGPGAPPSDSSQSTAPEAVQRAVSERFQGQDMEMALAWIENLKQLKPGEIFGSPVNQADRYLLIRLVSIERKGKGERYQVEFVGFPKVDFGQWLEAEKAKVKVSR